MNKEHQGRELSNSDYKPMSSFELDTADADARVAEQRKQAEALKAVRDEPESPEEREVRLQNLHRLRSRYGSGDDSDPRAA